MVTHKKPTKQELEEGIQKTIDAIDEVPEEPETPPEEPQPEEKQADEELSEEVLEEEPSEEESQPEEVEPTPEVPEPSPDYKKKFVESSKEAQILYAKNKKVNEAIEAAGGITDPTDEEMTEEYPDWELMGDVEKKLAREGVVNKKRFEILHKAALEGKDIAEWNAKVEKFIDDPKTLSDNPDLEGKAEDFKLFAMKPTRKGVDFEDLVAAFLYDVNKKPKMKGKMFEIGSSGASGKPKGKAGKISLAEADMMRQKDYNKYKEFVKAGKIDVSEI